MNGPSHCMPHGSSGVMEGKQLRNGLRTGGMHVLVDAGASSALAPWGLQVGFTGRQIARTAPLPAHARHI